MRARGLKLKICPKQARPVLVAPHAGAWIETFTYFVFVSAPGSRPMRARGLKLSAEHALI